MIFSISHDLLLILLSLIFNLVKLFTDQVLGFLNSSFHIFHAWEDVSVVNHSGSLCAWVHEEDEEAKFKEEVEWDECKNEAGPLVDDIKKTEHDPIGEPLLIIVTTITL